MRISKECPCCQAIYTIAFTELMAEMECFDDDNDSSTEASDQEPCYCPFCGVHESEDPDDLIGE